MPPLAQAPTEAMAKKLLALLHMIARHEHAQLLELLPNRLAVIPQNSVVSTRTCVNAAGWQAEGTRAARPSASRTRKGAGR
jgi:hypothetical protein